jgi:hypothetical protein
MSSNRHISLFNIVWRKPGMEENFGIENPLEKVEEEVKELEEREEQHLEPPITEVTGFLGKTE